jgi:hypothetical protein
MAGYRWVIEVSHEDGTPICKSTVQPDASPIVESARFEYLRRHGPAAADTFDREVELKPAWSAQLGEPYVHQIGAYAGGEQCSGPAATAALRGHADRIANGLVAEGILKEGATFRYVVTAYPGNEPEEAAADKPRFQMTTRPVAVQVTEGSWQELAGSLPLTDDTDYKLAVPQRILDEAARLTRSRSGVETGGILIGHVRWDPALKDIFIEVTEQIHARHAAGTETKLTFTPECWTDVRGTIDLRRRGELVVGWWHSHPVRVFCAKCPRERQEKCELRKGFLSSDDRMLHRTVFPRAFMPALVASDTAFGEVEFAMFGWRDGLISRRGFHVIGGADSVGWVRPENGLESRENKECEQNSN